MYIWFKSYQFQISPPETNMKNNKKVFNVILQSEIGDTPLFLCVCLSFTMQILKEREWSHQFWKLFSCLFSVKGEVPYHLFCILSISPAEIRNWLSYTEGKERPKKVAGHSRFVGGDKQGGLTRCFVFRHLKTNRSQHQPTKILKVYVENLMGFSHIYHPEGLSNTSLSKLYPSNSSGYGNDGWITHSKDRSRWEASNFWVQLKGQPEVTSFQWPHPTPLHTVLQETTVLCMTLRKYARIPSFYMHNQRSIES